MTKTEDFLAHYGVLGMKWGVLRSEAELGDKRATKKLSKLDHRWEKELNSTTGFIKVHNSMADKMNGSPGKPGEIEKLNNQARFKDKQPLLDSELKQPYLDEYAKITVDVFDRAVNDVYGESPSGKYSASYDEATGTLKVIPNTLKHGYDSDGSFSFKMLIKNGYFDELDVEDLKHSNTEDFLAHYGVLGMKWGQTRTDAQLEKAAARRGSSHEDYNNSRDVLKTPTNRVSTRDLKSTNQRLQQEKTLRDLRNEQKLIVQGKNQVQNILALTTVAASVYALGKSPLGVKAISSGKGMIGKLLASNGKHAMTYLGTAVKVAKHLK